MEVLRSQYLFSNPVCIDSIFFYLKQCCGDGVALATLCGTGPELDTRYWT
jgi:hypothetical protein